MHITLGPVIRSIFLLFYSILHPSKHEKAIWSNFSPSDILGKLRAKLGNSLNNLEEFGGNCGGVREGGVMKFLFLGFFFMFWSNQRQKQGKIRLIMKQVPCYTVLFIGILLPITEILVILNNLIALCNISILLYNTPHRHYCQICPPSCPSTDSLMSYLNNCEC